MGAALPVLCEFAITTMIVVAVIVVVNGTPFERVGVGVEVVVGGARAVE